MTSRRDWESYISRLAVVHDPVKPGVATLTIEPPKPSKYRNRSTLVDGIRFQSRLEAHCYEELKLRQAAGDVLWFIRQVPFELEGGVRYRADFLAVLAKGGIEVIDAKGYLTETARIKLRQVKARYGVHVTLWRDRKA